MFPALDTMISVTQETSLLKDYKRLLRENAMKFLMDDMYRNPGPLQFDGPGSDAKSVTLCVEGQDYIGRIKKLQEYLEKMHITSERLHKQSVVIKQICKLFPQCRATFPGLWLSDIMPDSYNVPEVHESPKLLMAGILERQWTKMDCALVAFTSQIVDT
ncbi:uncharacterized protein LOC131221191 isoform X2 [Magnolia sinica]|uniref:uncharacterized protein LOC131221191 isoform X2 n=1 Tax=Magnolia sinica TaxID=86752 RepID=UPI002659A912|nr:uncharacterized protein LOC131221191 isoform X2 [Magnolia sinica]